MRPSRLHLARVPLPVSFGLGAALALPGLFAVLRSPEHPLRESSGSAAMASESPARPDVMVPEQDPSELLARAMTAQLFVDLHPPVPAAPSSPPPPPPPPRLALELRAIISDETGARILCYDTAAHRYFTLRVGDVHGGSTLLRAIEHRVAHFEHAGRSVSLELPR